MSSRGEEKCLNLLPGGSEPALLIVGLAAAPPPQSGGHLFGKIPKIPLPGHETEAIGAVLTGEHRSRAAAAFRDGIRQLPEGSAVQSLLKLHQPPLKLPVRPLLKHCHSPYNLQHTILLQLQSAPSNLTGLLPLRH